MTGYELRLWRKGLSWTQERAAEELDVSLRTYKRYEKHPAQPLPLLVEHSTRLLMLQQMLPELEHLSRDAILIRIHTMLENKKEKQ